MSQYSDLLKCQTFIQFSNKGFIVIWELCSIIMQYIWGKNCPFLFLVVHMLFCFFVYVNNHTTQPNCMLPKML